MNHHFALSIAPLSLWIFFVLGIFVFLTIDLFLFSKAKDGINVKSALLESVFWIGLSLTFNLWFSFAYGHNHGVDFLTSYLVEKSLSVDNLFVMLLIFKSLKIPQKAQHRVLFYGVLGAVVLRGVFILLGAQIVHSFHWVFYIFGLILLYTAFKLVRQSDDDHEKEDQEKWILSKIKSIIPTTDQFKGHDFFILEKGVRKATPLFIALIAVEISDIIFAVDSIPAVFAITTDSFVAFSSNILAVLGLRALYFVLAEGAQKLLYLEKGLAIILSFIGIKMLINDFYHIPGWVSLGLIFSILLTIAIISWWPKKNK
jgi:tellurite resistance protein TerC